MAASPGIQTYTVRGSYESGFYDLLEHGRKEALGLKRKFRFKHKLLSIDSTTSLSMFDWAQYKRSKGVRERRANSDLDGADRHAAGEVPATEEQFCLELIWWRYRGSSCLCTDLMTWLEDRFQAPPALAGVHDTQLATLCNRLGLDSTSDRK